MSLKILFFVFHWWHCKLHFLFWDLFLMFCLVINMEYLQALAKEQTCQVISSLCRSLGIECTQTTAYHPQGNGQVEHFNRTLEAMLAKLVKENQKDWDLHIPKVLFAYRTALHESMGYSPYQFNFGWSPNLPVDVMLV